MDIVYVVILVEPDSNRRILSIHKTEAGAKARAKDDNDHKIYDDIKYIVGTEYLEN